MPTNKRRIQHELTAEVPLGIVHFLTEGMVPLPDDAGPVVLDWFAARTYQAPYRAQAIARYGDVILAAWIAERPGCRPDWWWLTRAPEPCRKRLGGTGTPSCECLAVVKHLDHGIPDSWLDQGLYDYYCRTDGDFEAGVPISETDPPRYESEAAYLRRHNLLTPAEVKAAKGKGLRRAGSRADRSKRVTRGGISLNATRPTASREHATRVCLMGERLTCRH